MVTLNRLEIEAANYNLTDSLKELSFEELQCCFYSIINDETNENREKILECLLIEMQYRRLTLGDILYSDSVNNSRRSVR